MMAQKARVAQLQYVHNVPLMLAAEVGVPGGLAWVWLWIAPLVLLVKRRYHLTHPEIGALVMSVFAVGIIALWDSYPWSLESGRLLSIMLFGLLVGSLQQLETGGGVWEK